MSFCDLRPFVQQQRVFSFEPRRLFLSPFGRLNQLQRWRDLQRLDQLAARMAREIDHGGYDLVYAHPSQWTQAPLVLRHLRTPAVYHMHEPLRQLYEAERPRPYLRAARGTRLDRLDPLIPLYRRRLAALDRQSTRRATRRA